MSMMARSTNAPCKGRIQMRKTNPLRLLKFGLQRTAGPYSWVIRVDLATPTVTSGLRRTTDILVGGRHVPNGPFSDSCAAATWVYSITSSARTRKDSEIFSPRALAVFELTRSSKRVGRSAGRSAGLVPFRILAAMTPISRYISSRLGP
jgi:hypothetical protein